MTVLAIIPARGGSKRIERKNLVRIGDKLLIDYTVNSAIACGVFDHIVLTSDDPDIRNHVSHNCMKNGSSESIFSIHKENPLLAVDDGRTVDVIMDVLDNLINPSSRCKYDYICLLEPTTLFRTPLNIVESVQLAKDNKCGVISVCKCKYPPQWNLYLHEDGTLSPALYKDASGLSALGRGDVRTQDQEPIYRPNGAMYIVPWDEFMRTKNLFLGKLFGYVMTERYSVDIDEQDDLDYAKWLLDTGKVVVT